MSIIKGAFISASLVLAATAVQAQTRADLESGFHGNTPVTMTYVGGPKSGITQAVRNSYARAHALPSVPARRVERVR